MIDLKQPENVEKLSCMGSMITNDGSCTYESKSRIAVAKADKPVFYLFTPQ
jgi:hypothetical protein